MEWIIVSGLILAGLLLLVIEILFVPGTTLVGLLGFILVVVGVALSFQYFGTQIGWFTIGGSTVLSGLAVYISFKSKLWSKFSLTSSMTGSALEVMEGKLQLGQEGKTLSSLRPIGKAEFGNIVCEVKTRGTYLDAGVKIKVAEISGTQVIVETLN